MPWSKRSSLCGQPRRSRPQKWEHGMRAVGPISAVTSQGKYHILTAPPVIGMCSRMPLLVMSWQQRPEVSGLPGRRGACLRALCHCWSCERSTMLSGCGAAAAGAIAQSAPHRLAAAPRMVGLSTSA